MLGVKSQLFQMLTKYQKNINAITTLISGDCDEDSEGGEGDGEEGHDDALKARLLYEGQLNTLHAHIFMKIFVTCPFFK